MSRVKVVAGGPWTPTEGADGEEGRPTALSWCPRPQRDGRAGGLFPPVFTLRPQVSSQSSSDAASLCPNDPFGKATSLTGAAHPEDLFPT